MQTIHHILPLDDMPPVVLDTFTDQSIFFDIETTGFSPAHSTLYLIGCATRSNMQMEIWQFFAETKEEQKDILIQFLNLLEQKQQIITFHGMGFDLPYLKAKCEQFHLNERFDTFESLDLYKSVSRLKFLLDLPDYKQKTVEQFLGLKREDRFTGGELIEVYYQYEKHPSEEAKKLLLLHNYEDVIGMPDLLPVLSYEKIFQKTPFYEKISHKYFRIADISVDDIINTSSPMLYLSLQCPYEFPVSIQTYADGITLSLDGTSARISVPLYCGELRFFYENYRDYYYLPNEDMAVHKSVAAFVDKNFREKAKASTCYTRKSGRFLPQFTTRFTPAFKKDYHDKISYFELQDDFLSSTQQLEAYAGHLLSHFSGR